MFFFPNREICATNHGSGNEVAFSTPYALHLNFFDDTTIVPTILSIFIAVAILRLHHHERVLGACSSVLGLQDQKVLGVGSEKSNLEQLELTTWPKHLTEKFGVTPEAKATWGEVALFAPGAVRAFEDQLLVPKPVKNKSSFNTTWEYTVHGADVQRRYIQDERGNSHRKVDGKLDNFSLRAKKVDPGKLGVDTVKQYSGYLDDNEKDKHLFYCKLLLFVLV